MYSCEGRGLASDGAKLFADFQLTGDDEILASLAPDRMRVSDSERFIKAGDVRVDDVGSVVRRSPDLAQALTAGLKRGPAATS
jgi:hypothetical protein